MRISEDERRLVFHFAFSNLSGWWQSAYGHQRSAGQVHDESGWKMKISWRFLVPLLFVMPLAVADDAKPAEEKPAAEKKVEAKAEAAPVVEAKQVLEVFQAFGAVADVFAGAVAGEVVGADPLEQQLDRKSVV